MEELVLELKKQIIEVLNLEDVHPRTSITMPRFSAKVLASTLLTPWSSSL